MASESRTGDRLGADVLRWSCDALLPPFGTTVDIEPITGVIGQDDAIEALRYGLEVFAPGQNIYVRGIAGTGRKSLVRQLLEDISPGCPLADDRCYVHNFAQPGRPRLIALPRGRGRDFCPRCRSSDRVRRRGAGPGPQRGFSARQACRARQGRPEIDS